MNKLILSRERDSQIYVFAFLTSIVLSYFIGYRNHVINPDGICYLLSAQIVGSAPIKDVMHLCPQSQWPFYSALIYALAQLSHFSYSASAHIINGIFSLISIGMFIAIIKELGGNRRILWLAAFVVLFSHQFNVLRDNIIRDHGFWAFYLISFYCLLKYFREPKWTTALVWNASLMMATLFRIEGIIFLLGMPFISWFHVNGSFKERTKLFFTLNSPLIFICFLFVAWQLFHTQQGLQKLGRVGEVINQLQNGFFILADRYQKIKGAITYYNILPSESRADAGAIILMGLITWYLYNVAITLSWGYAALLFYAWMKRTILFSPKSSRVVWGYILINLIMTLVFLAEHLFISKRYLVALTLILMIWVPFALNDLIQKWGNLRPRVFLIIASFFIFASALSGVVEFGQSKLYIRSAGNWLADNVPANASLYVNDFQLMYYSDHFGTHIFELLPKYLNIYSVSQGQWKKYDYVALRLHKKEDGELKVLMNELAGLTPVKEFSNQRGNRVVVYKIV